MHLEQILPVRDKKYFLGLFPDQKAINVFPDAFEF